MSLSVMRHPEFNRKDYGPATVNVHGGEPRDMYGSLIPPIYQTSTFYFDSTDDAVQACDDYAASFAYSRITNPSNDYFEKNWQKLNMG